MFINPLSEFTDIPHCRQCGSSHLSHIGMLPPCRIFAGKTLDVTWPEGYLRRCRECSLVFRDPVASEEKYEALYADTPSTVWLSSRPRGDTAIVTEILAKSSAESIDVLDLGCYTGQLLSSLDIRFQKYGVEASKEAAAVAQSNGINIMARTMSELWKIQKKFDVVVAMDVVEHVLNPSEFLKQMLDLTRPGGLIVVSSGDADVWPWRLAGSAYWYTELIEHVSFISSSWTMQFAAEQGLNIENITKFRYYNEIKSNRRRTQFRYVFVAIKYAIRHFMLKSLRGREKCPNWVLGEAGLFADHFVFALRKP